eukprot:s1671_g2.t1
MFSEKCGQHPRSRRAKPSGSPLNVLNHRCSCCNMRSLVSVSLAMARNIFKLLKVYRRHRCRNAVDVTHNTTIIGRGRADGTAERMRVDANLTLIGGGRAA